MTCASYGFDAGAQGDPFSLTGRLRHDGETVFADPLEGNGSEPSLQNEHRQSIQLVVELLSPVCAANTTASILLTLSARRRAARSRALLDHDLTCGYPKSRTALPVFEEQVFLRRSSNVRSANTCFSFRQNASWCRG
jgi:hypothetical protein